MLLNHLQTIPPTSVHGKIVFHETNPGVKKAEDLCFGTLCLSDDLAVLLTIQYFLSLFPSLQLE